MSVFAEAASLVLSGDPELLNIAGTSVRVTMLSVIGGFLISVPVAYGIHVSPDKLRRVCSAGISGLMALPTVVIGLFVYGLISSEGLLGGFGLLFTPWAIVIGQTILAVPVISSMLLAGFSQHDPRLRETLRTLGAGPVRSMLVTLRHSSSLCVSSLMGGFGRIIGEVGVSMLLGGNIRWYTRTMTTAIALETGKGQFSLALALGLILLCIALGCNALAHLLPGRSRS